LRQQEKELAKALGRDTQSFSAQATEDTFVPPFTSQHDAAARPPSPGSSRPFSLSLSSLPSSFTTLLLSIVDSPAYANLTSNYLNTVFNPATPDDPGVKYWSVAGRMSSESVSVWHPFWLPKMVLDGVEETEREKLKKLWENASVGQEWGDHNIPLWANEREWGNDGLVTVQSAKWGEFLGIMEGCDRKFFLMSSIGLFIIIQCCIDWEMRGARGIEFGVDLPAIPVIGLGSVLPTSSAKSLNNTPPTDEGDGWGFGDWRRFVVAWMKSKSDAAATQDRDMTETQSQSQHRDQELSPLSSSPSQPQHGTSSVKYTRERLADDEAVRSRTDTLSAVFDWLIERVPAPKRILGAGSTGREGGVNEVKHRNSPCEGKAGLNVKEADEVVKNSESLEKQVITNTGWDEKESSTLAVTYTVSHGLGSSASTSSTSTRTSEIKHRTDSGRTKLKKPNELGSKDDLERFYVALTRKMYDEGL
jgi:triacylglycerol lipase